MEGSHWIKNKNSGLTLIEALVGSTLVLIIFLGVFGAFQLGIKVVGLSKSKITAIAIASQRLELIKNLPYESIGTQGGYPDGTLESATSTLRNGVIYTIETRVDYVPDAADGIAEPEDECPNDYKKTEVKVSWSGRFGGQVKLSTNIVPKNLAQECAQGGGILSVAVFNAFGAMIPSPLIEIKDPATGQTLKTATPISGEHYFSLPPGSYKVIISKEGYNLEQTYGSGDLYQNQTIITPEKNHPIVIEGQLSKISFSIDQLSSFSVQTLSNWSSDGFFDSFTNDAKISEIVNLSVSGGEVAFIVPTDQDSGQVTSVAITPENLISWGEFAWSDNEPTDTDIKYQVLYFDGAQWSAIPDESLPGNSVGFGTSPLDLSGLDKTAYSQIKLKANFSTLNLGVSPSLQDWQVSWQSSNSSPVPNADFALRGEKIVGHDSFDNPIYKYSQNLSSNSQGLIEIPGLEWDLYTFAVDPASGLDLVGIDPSPQPVSLAPASHQTVKLSLSAENSLLVTVQNLETLEPVFSATVALTNTGLGYSETLYTNEKGQVYFIPLKAATYNLNVAAASYASTQTSASVSGYTLKTVKIEQIE